MAEVRIEIVNQNNSNRISDGMVRGVSAVSNFTSENCTALSTLDLTDVITRLSIGNEEYWGAMSTTWLSVFYIYVVVCCPLLLIISCWYLWILWKKVRSTKIKNRSFAMIQLICNYCMWSFTTFIHQLLTIVEVNATYPDKNLAVASKIFEQLSFATLINGLTIVAMFEYCLLQYKFGNRSVIYSLCGIPTFLIVIVIIIILLSASGSVLVVMVILMMMVVVIGVGSVTTILVMTYRLGHRRLKSLYKVVITSYILMVLLSYHLINALVKVTAYRDCVEDAQGNRVSWLVVLCIVMLLELLVGYQMADFVRPWRRQRHIQQPHLTINVKSVLQNDTVLHCVTKSTRDLQSQEIVSESLEAKTNTTKATEILTTGGTTDGPNNSKSNATKPREPNKETKWNDNVECIEAPTPTHIECVSLPISSHKVEECLSHAFDEYSFNKNSCLQLEQSGSFYDASDHKPECNNLMISTINLPLEFSCKPAVRNNTFPISSLHGRFEYEEVMHCT